MKNLWVFAAIFALLSLAVVSKELETGYEKEILQAGDGEHIPAKGDVVYVHYRGTLNDGTEFDSSIKRNKPFSFTLGQNRVIKCWEKGVATMSLGEKALLTCSPDFAYGARGHPPTIPAKATLMFEVELLDFKRKGGDL